MSNTRLASPGRRDDALPAPPLANLDRISLFVDLDGTIAPLEETPQAVGPDQDRRKLLDALGARLGGRLAVISGRALTDLDRVLEGRVPAIGAVHGLVLRTPDGRITETANSDRVREALDDFHALAAVDRSLLVEDKGAAASLHFRRHPEAGPACRDLAMRVGARLGLAVQEGDMVVEVRAPGPDKGEAVAAFMSKPPFGGRTPVFLGDDLTDENGFRAARRLGGYGVIVGPRRPTSATYALASVDEARAWLNAMLGAQG